MLASIGLVALLGCESGPGIVGGGITPNNPEYWVDGECFSSFKLQGEGNPVGFSVYTAVNEDFRTNYKDIGTFGNGEIIVPSDDDIGDHASNGVGEYVIREDELLTINNAPRFFEEGYFGNCTESEECEPLCLDGKLLGEHINLMIQENDAMVTTTYFHEGDTRVKVYFPINNPWGGMGNCWDSSSYIYSGNCSNL